VDIDYQIIATAAQLDKTATALAKESHIAVDIEADSMYHFKEKVCLVQMAAGKKTVIVDPIKVKDLSPLKSVFSNRKISKIFHGADYDIRSLYRDFGFEINNLFDTETACRFLGFKETGLETVIGKYFNIHLDKKYQKKDWSKRPLPEEMMTYAAIDVAYLIPLARILAKELKRIGRLSWVLEECETLSGVRPMVAKNEPLFLKFKGAGRLEPKSLAVLEALLQYRKKLARKKDRPLFKIVGNGALMKIAMAKPSTLKRLKDIKVLSSKQIHLWGDEIIQNVVQALQLPRDQLPVYPRKKAPVLPPGVPKRVQALKKWRDKRAADFNIDPGLLCNNTLIGAIAVANPQKKKELEKIDAMKQWQKKELGKDIISVLRCMT
jgi:ribonuclease D